MQSRFPAFLLASALLLPGCGSPSDDTESAEDFAARIGTGFQGQAPASGEEIAQTAPVPNQTGQDGQPLRRTIVPGTYSDPAANICGAPELQGLLGRIYSEALDAEIDAALPEGATFRPIPYGRNLSGPRTPNRLNLMLDQSGIIRDLRCG